MARSRKRSRRRSQKKRRRDDQGPEVSGVVVLDSDGSGRLVADNPERGNVWLPPEELAGARPGDRATVCVRTPRRGRPS